MEKKIIIIDPKKTNMMTDVFQDVADRADVIYLGLYKNNKTKFDKFLNKLSKAYIRIVNRFWCPAFLEHLAGTRLPLVKFKFESGIQYIIFFGEGTVGAFSKSFIQSLKDRGIHIWTMFFNSRAYLQPKVVEESNVFGNNIFSFDKGDCDKYGYILSHSFFSKIVEPSDLILYDLYYIGAAKDRFAELMSIFNAAKDRQVNCNINVSGVPKENRRQDDGIAYLDQFVPYRKALYDSIRANCILEILGSRQSDSTMRYYEAVCYNRKLLTNNKNVVNLPFYNPDYIHVFEKPEDIDWEWVKERIPVDYHYDGRFSPTHLIDRIIELEKEKEGKPSGPEQTS